MRLKLCLELSLFSVDFFSFILGQPSQWVCRTSFILRHIRPIGFLLTVLLAMDVNHV